MMNFIKCFLFTFVMVLILIPSSSAMNLLGMRWGYFNSDLLPGDYNGSAPDRIVGPYLGGYLAGGEFFYVGAYYNSVKVKKTSGSEIYGRVLQPYAGIRYYIGSHAKNNVVPYIMTEFYKSFTKLEGYASITYNSEDIDYLKKLYSPWGYSVGMGADYGVSKAFFIGMEVGLKWFYTKPDAHGGNVFGTVNEKRRETRLYTLLHLNFAW